MQQEEHVRTPTLRCASKSNFRIARKYDDCSHVVIQSDRASAAYRPYPGLHRPARTRLRRPVTPWVQEDVSGICPACQTVESSAHGGVVSNRFLARYERRSISVRSSISSTAPLLSPNDETDP